jgi:hypothetical protein
VGHDVFLFVNRIRIDAPPRWKFLAVRWSSGSPPPSPSEVAPQRTRGGGRFIPRSSAQKDGWSAAAQKRPRRLRLGAACSPRQIVLAWRTFTRRATTTSRIVRPPRMVALTYVRHRLCNELDSKVAQPRQPQGLES